MHQLIQAWPADPLPQLQQAWKTTHASLQSKQHPWYTVKGPMAATIAYMTEWGWDVQELLHWTRPETDLTLANEVHMTEQWWQLEHLFYNEAQQQRTNRFARRPNHQHLLTGLDWHTFKQLKGKLPEQQRRHLQTWVQGALHFKDATGTNPCPICQVPATPKHVLWLCKWHRNQNHQPLPPEWLERITSQEEEEALWSKGWIPLEPQEHLQQVHPYHGHGVWQDLQPIGPDQYAGFAFTLDATPSHYDQRSQIWVFGLCLHTQTMALCWLSGIGQTYNHPSQSDCAAQLSLGSLAQITSQAPVPRPPGRGHRPGPPPHHRPLHQPQHQDPRRPWQRAPTSKAPARCGFDSLGTG